VNAFAYRKRTAIDVRLRLLDYASASAPIAYGDALIAVSAGVRKSAQRISRRAPGEDVFTSDETQIISF
jgi:hypothetical protein